MERPSSGIRIPQVILFGLLVCAFSACTEGTRDKYPSVSEQTPEGFGTPEFVCKRSYWCADIKGPLSAKQISVAEKGRFSQVGIGLPKEHEIKNALEVNGTILAEEILVEAEVADYVFAPTYDLKPLEFVEGFINTHQHLPGIPSRSSVEATGGKISIGDFYQNLLEKVEELTLYAIEQDKRIAELEKTLARQTELKASTPVDY